MGFKAYGVLLLLTALIAGAWFSLIGANANESARYNEHVATAREKAEQGVVTEVLSHYRSALQMNPTREIAVELMDFSKINQDPAGYKSVLREVIGFFPTEALGYERLTSVYIDEEDYESAFEVFEAAGRNEVTSDELRASYASIRYVHEIGTYAYDDVRTFHRGDVAAVYTRGSWSFMEAVGRTRGDNYTGAYSFYGNYAPVVIDGVPQFVNRRYQTVLIATKTDYVSYGTLDENVFPAKQRNGRTVFLNTSFDPVLGGTEFDHASSFANGLAGVQQVDGVWKILTPGGVQVGEDYTKIAENEGGVVYSAERYFAAPDAKYRMYDGDGAQVGSLEFEDARPFNDDGYAAVQVSGKWGFVNTDGELVIDPEYDDARSFANGLAAVQQGEYWGYVSESGDIAIEPRFLGALDFSESGTAFIKRGDGDRVGKEPAWYFLQLTRSKV